MGAGVRGRVIQSVPFLILACVLLFSSCERMPSLGKAKEGAYLYEEDYAAEELLDEAPVPEAAKRAAPAESDRGETGVPLAEEEPSSDAGEPFPVKADRRRVYSGYAKVLVDSVERKIEEILSLATVHGGYVESVYEHTVIIRVPAEKFSAVFQQILALGETLDKREETYDVTEYYTDLETRLGIAEATRERLYALLQKTTDVEERLKILREIRRLTEEIETIEGNLRLLKELIAFSRITVELVPRLSFEEEARERIPFGWIAALDPLYVSLPVLRGRIDLDLGDQFAQFEKERAFRSESADGVRVRVGTAPNDPKGDGGFWQTALAYHLDRYYGEHVTVEAGQISAVLLTSKDREPFYYLVGIYVDGRKIHVVEVFFPDRSALQAKRDIIMEALAEMRVR